MEIQMEENVCAEEIEITEDINMSHEINVHAEENEGINMSHENVGELENEVQEPMEETQKSLYVLQNIDTETSIKTEIKQIKLTKISQKTRFQAMKDRAFDLQQQVLQVRKEDVELFNEKQQLDEAVQADLTKLIESEEMLTKADEMVQDLKDKVDKLEEQMVKSEINPLLEKSKIQFTSVKSLNEMFEKKSHLQKIIDGLSQTDVVDSCDILKENLIQKKTVLLDLNEKCDELNKIITAAQDNIEKQMLKKDVLENKCSEIKNVMACVERDNMDYENKSRNHCKKTESQVIRFNTQKERKAALEKLLEEGSNELDKVNAEYTEIEKRDPEIQEHINELKSQLDVGQTICENKVTNLQESSKESTVQLKSVITEATTIKEINEKLQENLNNLRGQYVEKRESQVLALRRNLEHQASVHAVKLVQLHKQMENKSKRAKYEEVTNQQNTLVTSLNSLSENIVNEEQKQFKQLTIVKAKLENAQIEHNQHLIETKTRKDYLSANSKCLDEKSESLRVKAANLEDTLKKLQRNNSEIQDIIDSKFARLNERKIRLAALKNNAEVEWLKPEPKPILNKKVQFNDTPSYKSASSSDCSFQGTSKKPAVASFEEWLLEAAEELKEKFN